MSAHIRRVQKEFTLIENKTGGPEATPKADGEDEIIIEDESLKASPKESQESENQKLVANLKKDLERAKNDHLYLMAEFDNYRKRAIKERSDYMKYAAERPLGGILEVLDNFERAIQVEVTPENFESFKKGVELISEELKSTLKKFGVQEVPAEGAKFDPTIHEAIGTEETDSVEPGMVSRVIRKAYKLHDKIIRPAQVMVATEKKS
jgi:molecular chaperone GrpE